MTTPDQGRTRTAWLDAGAGVAGDMLLAALLDAGADLGRVVAAVQAVEENLDVVVERTERHQISAVKATVVDRRTGRPAEAAEPAPDAHDHDHPHDHPHAHDEQGHEQHGHEHHPATPHRSWRDVRALLTAAQLDQRIKVRAIGAFARLARAEGVVHGIDAEQVRFHEVGALDAIGEVVGVAAAMADLGLAGFGCSTVTVGSGDQVHGQHGRIPIPGPAVVQLLREAHAPVVGGPVTMEMTTPTGAALLAEYATGFGPAQPMTITATGIGAGTRNPPRLANVTRLVIGVPAQGGPVQTEATVLEANVDDLDPRLWPAVLGSLIAAGAADAWLTPMIMKKGRPAHTVSVLCSPDQTQPMIEILVRETSTIGVRSYPVTKHVVDRRFETVEVAGQAIAVKIATWAGQVVNAQPEFADVERVASATGVPTKVVLAEAIAAASALYRS